MPSSRASSQPRDQTWVSCTPGRFKLSYQGSPVLDLGRVRKILPCHQSHLLLYGHTLRSILVSDDCQGWGLVISQRNYLARGIIFLLLLWQISENLEVKTTAMWAFLALSCCYCSVAQSCPTLCDPWTAARQASLSITNSRGLLELMSTESVMSSNHLVSIVPFSSCLQSFPASESFLMSWLFTLKD